MVWTWPESDRSPQGAPDFCGRERGRAVLAHRCHCSISFRRLENFYSHEFYKAKKAHVTQQ